MAESEEESDFASAESEQEDEQETVEGKDVKGNDGAESQMAANEQKKKDVDEEREGRGEEGGEGEKRTAEGREGEERRGQEGEGEEITAEGGGEMISKEGEGSEQRKRAGNENEEEEVIPETVSSIEPTDTSDSKPSEDVSGEETVEKEKTKSEEKVEGEASTVESSEDKQGYRESDRESDRAPKTETAILRAEDDGGGGGGWGWGGWGRSLWSSVSTVTESAQVLGQKVTAAISTVEDALGLPTPQQLAKTEEGEEGEGEEGGEGREESRGVEALAKLAEKVVEGDGEPHADQSLCGPDSSPAGPQVEPESAGEQDESATGTIGAFSGFFSGIASVVEQRGLQLMSGGLDALENIGKKTMEVLTEGDPGLQNKRKLLKREAPSLSALLREAKAEAEAKQNEAETAGQQKGQAQQSYSSLFDEYQGVIHLEALELLSKEYAAKVRGCLPSLTGEEGDWVEGQMELLDHALTIREDGDGLAVLDDDSGKLGEVVELFSDVTPAVKVGKLVKISTFWREKLETMIVSCDDERDAAGNTEGTEEGESKEGERGAEGGKEDEEEEMESEEKEESSEAENKDNAKKLNKEEVYTNGLRGLVQLTSASIELFRKMAEVSLLPQATKADTIGQAKRFNRLTVLVSSELDALASVHAEVLTDLGLEDINTTITALYMESSNSVSYVQDALQLLKPVLQYTVLQEVALNQPSHNVHSRS